MEARAQNDDAEAKETDRAASNGGSPNEVIRQSYTPLFRAQNEDRYLRQALIRDYELGPHCIVVGPTSDLGTIDPQVLIGDKGFVSAKDLIAAVDNALKDIAACADTYPLQVAMLAGIDSIAVEFARSALASTDELAEQAIASNPDRTMEDVLRMCEVIQDPLISSPKSHSAVVGNRQAKCAGLPVRELNLTTLGGRKSGSCGRMLRTRSGTSAVGIRRS